MAEPDEALEVFQHRLRQAGDGLRRGPEVRETHSRQNNMHTFALLGGMNWIFKWYDPAGPITPEQLADDFFKIFSAGLQA